MQLVGHENVAVKIYLCGNSDNADIGNELDDRDTARIRFRYPNIDEIGHSAGIEAALQAIGGEEDDRRRQQHQVLVEAIARRENGADQQRGGFDLEPRAAAPQPD